MQEPIQLIQQAKSGNMKAFQQIVETYSHKTYAIAYRILNDKGHAQDCAQEVFVKLYHKLGSFDQRAKFSTWHYSIVVNCAIDMQRKLARHQNSVGEEHLQHCLDHETNSPEQQHQNQSLIQSTCNALAKLSPEVRVAFVLKHFEERTIDEISQILEVNPNTVKNRIFRGVSRLKELLSSQINDSVRAVGRQNEGEEI